MIAAVCVDDHLGMMFNHRRQSQDREARKFLLEASKNAKLWMNTYSAKQFGETDGIQVSDQFLSECPEGDFCFVENESLAPYAEKIEEIILIRWNRTYPADLYFDIPLDTGKWHCTDSREFPGFSHEKITVEVYEA